MEFEGACAFVAAIASSPKATRSISSLIQADNEILAIRAIGDAGVKWGDRKILADYEELIVQLTQGKARTVGYWRILADGGRFVNKAARNSTTTLIKLLHREAERDGVLDATTIENLHTGRETVTALAITQRYLAPGASGHVFTVTPDSQAFTPELRRLAQTIAARRRIKPSSLHLVVDTLLLTVYGGSLVVPGVFLVSGDDLARYANEPDDKYGRPIAVLSFVLTRQD